MRGRYDTILRPNVGVGIGEDLGNSRYRDNYRQLVLGISHYSVKYYLSRLFTRDTVVYIFSNVDCRPIDCRSTADHDDNIPS